MENQQLINDLIAAKFLLSLVALKRQFLTLANQRLINSHDRFDFGKKFNDLLDFLYDNETYFGTNYDTCIEACIDIDNLINLEIKTI